MRTAKASARGHQANRVSAALGALILLLTACGGDDGASTETGPGASTDATVNLGNGGDLGDVLVDTAGNTLYVTDAEADGSIACTAGCLAAWPPLTVESGETPTAGDGVDGALATVTRDDGTVQVTYEGLPLYTFASDSDPGDTTGHGISDAFEGTEFTWQAATPDGPASLDDDDGGSGPYGN